ncbi:MAG: ADP-heptose--LPS heptosyltransferase [Candidatus Binatia bacterium]|nr:MAG: ADP-heptose--LPS heptosyltransferase [Candidatus Binatia bacterium]
MSARGVRKPGVRGEAWRLGPWKHPAARAFGAAAGRWAKRVGDVFLSAVLPPGDRFRPEEIEGVSRVLLVRPNFRIGNVLLATPLIPALRERFPGAELDCLCGDTAAPLLEGLGVDRIFVLSRRAVLRPWEFVRLFRELRRRRYDVTVDAGGGSFSGSLYAYLVGARYRVGSTRTSSRLVNVPLFLDGAGHAYDGSRAIARGLGVSAPRRPLYRVRPTEKEEARRILGTLGLGRDTPFLGVFVGGHKRKRFPAGRWMEHLDAMGREGLPVVVFLGPEEEWLEGLVRSLGRPSIRVLRPLPLRLFAAVLAEASLVVSPDSGPLHLAAAVEVPTIAILRDVRSLLYCPRGSDDRALFDPEPEELLAAVRSTLPRTRASRAVS